MTTSLDAVRRKLYSRVRTLDAAFDRNILAPSNRRRLDRFAFQEGLVSALWQSWCAFCRATLIGSASGSVLASGQQVTSPYAGRPEMEIAYVAKMLSEGYQIKKIKTLKGQHQEPTWGDLDKVNRIAVDLNSTNQPQLLTAFGTDLTIKGLQLCRNASVHIHKDMLLQINSAKVRYSETKSAHPSDLIYWVDPKTKDFLGKTWVDEMLLVSQYAVV